MSKELSANTNLSHYRIVSKLGAGGMGEVYLAEDTELERQVALKILLAEVAGDEDRLRRFVQEARSASALNHPNILTVYEIGTFESSRFIASELIKGETLRERLRGESLTLREALDVTVQIASALNAAHSAGIIHRDIKPENVMLRDDGLVKVLDFGLAKLMEKKTENLDSESETRALGVKTLPGMVMGTVTYMSPQQARGKEVDARSDIWSLGVVVYEMLAKRTPFAGETTNDTLAAILTREPEPLDDNTPAELQRIVRKALQKKADERYQTVKDFLLDVKNLKRELEFAEELERSQIPHSTKASSVGAYQPSINATAILPAAIATQNSLPQPTSSAEYIVRNITNHKRGAALGSIILLALVGFGYWFFFNRTAGNKQIDSIAVLPFANSTGDKEIDFLSEGIAETLINNFTKIPELKVTARSTAFRFRGREGEPQEVGRELGVGSVLTGKLLQRGDTLSIQVDLINTSNGVQIWGNRYEGRSADIVNIQQRIATDVSSQLKLKLTGAQQQQVAKTYTQNSEAYQRYLRGRYYWNKRTADDLKKGLQEFQAAADIDPGYALAYVGLADCYVLLEEYAGVPSNETLPKAQAFAQKALQIDDSIGEAHATLGLINNYMWRWAEAEAELKRAIELNPNYPTAHHWYNAVLRDTGRFDEAMLEIKRAQELDPLSGIIGVNVGFIYMVKNDPNSAAAEFKRIVEFDPNWWAGHFFLGTAYLKLGRNEEALTELQKSVELTKPKRQVDRLSRLCLLRYGQAQRGAGHYQRVGG